MSGIRGLTARTLDGHSVRIIFIGERGKESSELYTSSSVKYESW
jgi:fatty acid synthase subunit alpha